MKEKKNILPGAIVAALLAAVIVFCVMLNVEKNALSAYEKGNVLTAQKGLVKGTRITESNVEQLFKEVQMDKSLIPDLAITDFKMLTDMAMAADIDSGAVLTASMMADINEKADTMNEPVVAGFKADDLYQVVSGILRSGDRIHLYTVDEEVNSASLVWENVPVQQVFDNVGNEIGVEDRTTAAQRVNILLEKESIELFYSELAAGSLRVVKAYE